MADQPQTPFARVLAVDPDARPEELTLEEDVSTIGRSDMCHITVPRKIVSRIHARIERDGPRYLLRDAGSANGTFVNRQRLSHPHLLQDGDSIGLGTAAPALRFLDPDPTFVPSGRLVYDEQGVRFLLDGRPLDLSAAQLRLLHHLYHNAGTLCTRESCAAVIWGRDYEPGMDAAALDRVVANLRAALRQADPAAELIQTRRGLGYVLEV